MAFHWILPIFSASFLICRPQERAWCSSSDSLSLGSSPVCNPEQRWPPQLQHNAQICLSADHTAGPPPAFLQFWKGPDPPHMPALADPTVKPMPCLLGLLSQGTKSLRITTPNLMFIAIFWSSAGFASGVSSSSFIEILNKPPATLSKETCQRCTTL